jgi:hypothetical protein
MRESKERRARYMERKQSTEAAETEKRGWKGGQSRGERRAQRAEAGGELDSRRGRAVRPSMTEKSVLTKQSRCDAMSYISLSRCPAGWCTRSAPFQPNRKDPSMPSGRGRLIRPKEAFAKFSAQPLWGVKADGACVCTVICYRRLRRGIFESALCSRYCKFWAAWILSDQDCGQILKVCKTDYCCFVPSLAPCKIEFTKKSPLSGQNATGREENHDNSEHRSRDPFYAKPFPDLPCLPCDASCGNPETSTQRSTLSLAYIQSN